MKRLFLGALLLCAPLLACNKATLEDSPDAAVKCNAGAYAFCDADAATGCSIGSAETDARLKQLKPGIYGPGCVANFVEDSRDQGGDCIVQSICRCNAVADAGAQWSCFP